MTVPEDLRPELESLFDPRFLAHFADRVDHLAALRAAFHDAGINALEIGSERGTFSIDLARAAPELRVLGIERRSRYHGFACERLERKPVDRVRFLHEDARLAVPMLIPPGSLDAIWVLFPDPWWKARHADRRVLDGAFLRTLGRRLRPGGRLYLKSDVFDYLYRVRAFAERSEAFRPLPAHLWPDERGWPLSPRERKCMDAGIPFGRGYYQVRADFPRELPQEPEPRDAWAIDEEVAPLDLIKGPPLVDIEHRKRGGRRRR